MGSAASKKGAGIFPCCGGGKVLAAEGGDVAVAGEARADAKGPKDEAPAAVAAAPSSASARTPSLKSALASKSGSSKRASEMDMTRRPSLRFAPDTEGEEPSERPPLKKPEGGRSIGSSVGQRSLRRSTSVYSEFATGDLASGLDGFATVKETKLMRAGSVKNTGVFVNQYAVVKNLGSGSFGKVKLAMDTVTGELVAMKVVMRANKQRKQMALRRAMTGMQLGTDPDQQFQREIAVMKKLSHPNVVQLIEVIDDPGESRMMLIMEYVDGGVLSTDEPMEEAQARKYFQDAAKGLHYLHKNSVVHGDVKPENMLVSDEEGVIKLSDFGSSSMFERGDTMNKTNGTPAFMCPEMCEAKPYHGRVADCWALAVCLWSMVFAKLPFQGTTVMALYDAIRDEELRFPEDREISPQLRDLLERCLRKDPDERLTLEEMMTHPWTTENGKYNVMEEDEQDAYDLAEQTRQIFIRQISQLLQGFPRRSFHDGEYLYMAGFDAGEIFFIEEGECEIVLRAQDIESLAQDQQPLGRADVPSDSDESEESEEESEEDDDMDLPNECEDGIVAPGDNKVKPAWALSKFSTSTFEMVKNVSGSLHRHMSRGARNSGEELLGRKAAGNFVGMIGGGHVSKHTASVRAKGDLKVVVISREDAQTFMDDNPKSSAPLKQAIKKRATENQVFSVMARLSTLHKSIQEKEKGRSMSGKDTQEDEKP
uniref:Calcium/calmodulin-dependent protein kinase kinase n=1 Tax=Tetraselmis sp. GSL018 TaxID=582737 RepID=A0A061QYE0_9CHLO